MSKPAPAERPEPADALQVNTRLYKQLDVLLSDLEGHSDASLRERIEAELHAKRATDATLRERIEEALSKETPITTRERIAALVAIARIQSVFVALRRESNEPGERGAAVRRYAEAFKRPAGNAARRGKGSTRASSAAIDAALADTDDDDEDDPAA